MYVETPAWSTPTTAVDACELIDVEPSLELGKREGFGGGGSSDPFDPETEWLLLQYV